MSNQNALTWYYTMVTKFKSSFRNVFLLLVTLVRCKCSGLASSAWPDHWNWMNMKQMRVCIPQHCGAIVGRGDFILLSSTSGFFTGPCISLLYSFCQQRTHTCAWIFPSQLQIHFCVAGSRRLLWWAVRCKGKVWRRNALCLWKMQWVLSYYARLLLWSRSTPVPLGSIVWYARRLLASRQSYYRHTSHLRLLTYFRIVIYLFILQYYRCNDS